MENYSEKQNVAFGKNEALSGAMSKDERNKAFYRLIQAEYKEEFKDLFNREFGRRFRQMKETEEELAEIKACINPLVERFRVSDIKDLAELIMKKTEENKMVNDAEFLRRQYDAWSKEAEDTMGEYPDFDFKKEFENPEFRAGLRAGISMTSLYRALHFDEISRAASNAAVNAAMDSIRAGSGRIHEVGSENSCSVKARKRVEDLTDAELDEFLERIRRGEKITFGV